MEPKEINLVEKVVQTSTAVVHRGQNLLVLKQWRFDQPGKEVVLQSVFEGDLRLVYICRIDGNHFEELQ
ncbi:hypothetical protein NDU88_008334 [Pleurodeles waltl]|uniref:Uncharacterized protein n=1 Tax=Pleurodeles waltl TaxID=8319 RepID=A0AAV7QNB8_PLEWA|nr:hypothetical protein NDU88_008334 [Pleurodeles waltl]